MKMPGHVAFESELAQLRGAVARAEAARAARAATATGSAATASGA